jgi:menaquinone-dependent protoporphyrinogen IX oxidase
MKRSWTERLDRVHQHLAPDPHAAYPKKPEVTDEWWAEVNQYVDKVLREFQQRDPAAFEEFCRSTINDNADLQG